MPLQGGWLAHLLTPGRCPGLRACCPVGPVGAPLLSNKIHLVKSRKRKPSPDNSVRIINVRTHRVETPWVRKYWHWSIPFATIKIMHYELWIMNYKCIVSLHHEFESAGTEVFLSKPMKLCIMHYELWIINALCLYTMSSKVLTLKYSFRNQWNYALWIMKLWIMNYEFKKCSLLTCQIPSGYRFHWKNRAARWIDFRDRSVLPNFASKRTKWKIIWRK